MCYITDEWFDTLNVRFNSVSKQEMTTLLLECNWRKRKTFLDYRIIVKCFVCKYNDGKCKQKERKFIWKWIRRNKSKIKINIK